MQNRATDKNGKEYRIPSNIFIWERMEPVNVEMVRCDINFIAMSLRQLQTLNQKIVEILKKAKNGTIEDTDRVFLPDSMKEFSSEQLAEQINSWIGLVDEYDWYAKKIEEYIGEKPKDPDGRPESWDWSNCQFGINGVANNE